MVSEMIGLILLQIVIAPFRIFWWAIKHDLGLLEKPPSTHVKASGSPRPSAPATLWDRELDGPDTG